VQESRLFVLRTDDHARSLAAYLKQNRKKAAESGRPLAVYVGPYRESRSAAQNRLYWAVLNHIAEAAHVDGQQFSSTAWHAYFAGKFIGFDELPDGTRAPISTTTLDVESFNEYLTQIQAYAATELGVESL
jgi:hypothetical protein